VLWLRSQRRGQRKEGDSPPVRAGWAATVGVSSPSRGSPAQLQARRLQWLKDEDLENSDELPEPEELATDAIVELRAAVEDLGAVLVALENGNGNGKGGRK
jgi:hypothetical protein